MYLDKMFMVAFILILIGTISIALWQHEFAHKIFNDKFGIESEYFIDLPWFIGVRSHGVQPVELKMMHGFNEAVSYNLTPYLAGIIAIIGMGFWFIGNKMDNQFEEFKKKGITIQALPPVKIEEIILDGVDYI